MIRKLRELEEWIFATNVRLFGVIAVLMLIAGAALYFGAERMDRLRDAQMQACFSRPCAKGLHRLFLTPYKSHATCLCVGDEP